MKQLAVKSIEELRAVVAELGDGTLFRGQNAHYENNGNTSVVTSFDRKGCIPSEMIKWARYASNVLDAYIGESADRLQFNQALLQHYGWRSFYVDCSASAAVAAWFASHRYSDRMTFELCEDCEERAVMLMKRMARYDFEDGEGHLYAFDKKISQKLIGVTDLAALRIEGARPRTEAQSAWLLGPVRKSDVPAQCFVIHITASRALFRDYAAEEGLTDTGHLFPSRKDDPLLAALLGLPWKKIAEEGDESAIGIPFFRRALDLPEYHDSFVKIAPPSTAFYQGARVAEFGSVVGGEYGGIAIPVPEITIFGTADRRPLRFPKVSELLASHRAVAFEIDELIQHATMRGMVLYQKGIAVTAHEANLVELSELMVEHPGLDMTRAGMNRGWFYRIGEDNIWRREEHPDECDCGNDRAHGRHISALHIVEAYLADPEAFSSSRT
jgi:hypothetical protein